ncbi:hypothetical protein AB0G04_33035 [Actinoplanes sp. NPDC023801]|uniref:hypothetical protein n=1 Tax=Actinoplanes sp. NPDC023801 TaxID=3154595 RepID=UPI0033C4C723
MPLHPGYAASAAGTGPATHEPEVMTMTSEPMDTAVPVQPRDRGAHGGAASPSDDGLAVRVERERVAAGLKPYASQGGRSTTGCART